MATSGPGTELGDSRRFSRQILRATSRKVGSPHFTEEENQAQSSPDLAGQAARRGHSSNGLSAIGRPAAALPSWFSEQDLGSSQSPPHEQGPVQLSQASFFQEASFLWHVFPAHCAPAETVHVSAMCFSFSSCRSVMFHTSRHVEEPPGGLLAQVSHSGS